MASFNGALSTSLLDQYYLMGLCLLAMLVNGAFVCMASFNGALSASQACLMGLCLLTMLDQYYLWQKSIIAQLSFV